MSKAWGHTVRPLTEQEIKDQIAKGKSWHQFNLDHPKEGVPTPELEKLIHLERKCRLSAKCDNESTHLLTYRYVTGRAGRTTLAEKQVCQHHATKYIQPN